MIQVSPSAQTIYSDLQQFFSLYLGAAHPASYMLDKHHITRSCTQRVMVTGSIWISIFFHMIYLNPKTHMNGACLGYHNNVGSCRGTALLNLHHSVQPSEAPVAIRASTHWYFAIPAHSIFTLVVPLTTNSPAMMASAPSFPSPLSL